METVFQFFIAAIVAVALIVFAMALICVMVWHHRDVRACQKIGRHDVDPDGFCRRCGEHIEY